MSSKKGTSKTKKASSTRASKKSPTSPKKVEKNLGDLISHLVRTGTDKYIYAKTNKLRELKLLDELVRKDKSYTVQNPFYLVTYKVTTEGQATKGKIGGTRAEIKDLLKNTYKLPIGDPELDKLISEGETHVASQKVAPPAKPKAKREKMEGEETKRVSKNIDHYWNLANQVLSVSQEKGRIEKFDHNNLMSIVPLDRDVLNTRKNKNAEKYKNRFFGKNEIEKKYYDISNYNQNNQTGVKKVDGEKIDNMYRFTLGDKLTRFVTRKSDNSIENAENFFREFADGSEFKDLQSQIRKLRTSFPGKASGQELAFEGPETY